VNSYVNYNNPYILHSLHYQLKQEISKSSHKEPIWDKLKSLSLLAGTFANVKKLVIKHVIILYYTIYQLYPFRLNFLILFFIFCHIWSQISLRLWIASYLSSNSFLPKLILEPFLQKPTTKFKPLVELFQKLKVYVCCTSIPPICLKSFLIRIVGAQMAAHYTQVWNLLLFIFV